MASVSVLVSAAHVSVSVLVSEVPALSTGFREPASVLRQASRPNLDGLGLGLAHPCLGLGLGGPGLDYNPVINPAIFTMGDIYVSSIALFLEHRHVVYTSPKSEVYDRWSIILCHLMYKCNISAME